MYGEKTLYRKIQVILEYAKEAKHKDVKSLVELVESNRPTNFLSSWRDKETDKVKHRYSSDSIERAIKICIDLKLLSNENLVLTSHGKSATDPRRFPTIIGNSAKEYLESVGVSIDSIVGAIKELLNSKNPVPPTSAAIWDQLHMVQGAISQEEFQRLLTLLGQGQILSMSQKRVFLPWS